MDGWRDIAGSTAEHPLGLMAYSKNLPVLV
jgi:hypothetical protein